VIGILVVTHGQFGEECIKSLSLITGEYEKLASLSLNPADSVLDLAQQVKETLDALDDGDGVLALVDLLGGSPFNAVASQMKDRNLECVTGLNMSMLMNAAEERDSCTLKELAALAMERAAEGIVDVTLDIGSDKTAEYFHLEQEQNPALGFRAIRICLTRPDIFRTQLRALCRASAYGNIAIMFPMITSEWEVLQAKELCAQVQEELAAENIPYNRNMEIGIMLETPAAVVIADILAQHVDFFSIGTNDLTQYTLAIDRQSRNLDRFYDAHHPAVLRMIRHAAQTAHDAGIWIGICGELGADQSLTETFLEYGVDEISVSPASVLPIRKVVRTMGLSVEKREE